MTRVKIPLQRFPDGTFIDWGRHTLTPEGERSSGPARAYVGEAAEVMALVIKHQVPTP
jgi:hypothetical protein